MIVLSQSLSLYSQCNLTGSITVGTTGFESGTGFTHNYVLVNDVTDENF